MHTRSVPLLLLITRKSVCATVSTFFFFWFHTTLRNNWPTKILPTFWRSFLFALSVDFHCACDNFSFISLAVTSADVCTRWNLHKHCSSTKNIVWEKSDPLLSHSMDVTQQKRIESRQQFWLTKFDFKTTFFSKFFVLAIQFWFNTQKLDLISRNLMMLLYASKK